MAIRIEWDEFEIALLIEACEEVLRKGKPKSEVVKTVSSNLRKRAISKNIAIDDVFRNENGIALQMQKMAYLLTHGEKGMPGASKLYAEVAELREENPKKFEEILKRAKEEIEMTDLSQQNIDKKALFAQWLNEHPIKKYTPSAIIDALDVASRYCVSKKVCKDGFWSMQNKAEFNAVASKLLSFRLFRLKYRSAAAKMDKAIPLYKAFLDSYVASREESAADFEVEASNGSDDMLSSATAKSDDTIQTKSENEKLYDKLYSISRIYDDPAGLSLNRITGLLGQSDDRELVQGILDHAPWAHRIENGIYSFASADTISARNEKKAGKDDTISDSAFYDYLDKTLCMAEPTCRSYVSAIRSAEKYAKDYGFTSYRIYDVTTSDAVALLNALMRDDGFAAYDIRQHNRFRAAFTKFAEMAGQSIVVKKTGAQLQNKPQEQPIAPFDKEKYIEILMCRYRNGITFDSIDFDNFRETYEDLYDSSIDADDDTLEKQLRLCGVFYNNRLFPAEGIMDDETREKLFTYIENSFSSGKKVLYYKAVFEDLADAFANCYSLADEHMLRVFIEFTADPDKYYFFKDYMSVEANVKIDDTAEVEDFLLSAGKPMKVEDVCTALTHIPKERVDSIIKFDSRFRRNAKGEYFHADIFEISKPELEKIAAIIDGSIAENGYAIWTDIWNKIQETMPVFLENNLYLSALGVRNAISAYYLGKFNFNGAVISRPEDRYEMRDIYQLYAKHHPTFTADDIYNLSKELDTVIYFEALSEVSVRVSHDLFISKEMISFDTDAVDRAINSFLSKDYIRIREIDSFLVFPNVGYEWNEYLLESFLLSYSKKFVLVNNGLSLNNVAGFVVKENGQIKEFVDACAAFLADGRIELKKVDALNYLADMNIISRRSYKDIDLALRRAAQIRRRKE